MYRILLIGTIFLLSISNIYLSQSTDNKTFTYREKKNEFIIVVEKESLSNQEAEKKALEKGAKLANKYGFRSFDVVSKKDVKILIGKEKWPSIYDFEQNLYQEEIVQKGYDRERTISESKQDNKLRKALKIQIKCAFSETEGEYKVCEIIKCK